MKSTLNVKFKKIKWILGNFCIFFQELKPSDLEKFEI